MRFHSYPIGEFWDLYDALPETVQEQADKQYSVFRANHLHPSLRFKQVGPYWSVRVSHGYRALAVRRGNHLYWFWIGPHDEYLRHLRA